jgi:hypothetical protein
MRTTQLVVLFVSIVLPVVAQANKASAPAPAKTASHVGATPADPNAKKQALESAMKFLEASDARPRMEQGIDQLIQEGEKVMMQRNPGLDPKFGDEWVKRMKERVKLEDFENITAKVYATYYTSDELDQMTQAQRGLKTGKIYTLAPELGQKIKANGPRIQKDINTDISRMGSSMSIEVGQEIEKEHPEWAKPLAPPPSVATPAPTAKK